ncbi:GAF domain-containing protein [Candidatus Kryptonium thompsonii]|uniref:GAF domain-containing protein n=1 Tax=Candidatus Kryptonium thompsonii TaxID=1633631 RepID=A0A0P1LL97_9BACT|nr:GAF domain-containing protein [Candidatus Kryptonium thompsoni]CUS77967.1 GAF domain-containing protein [Candidatus Kryptonium thompsoni]CUS80501.1 GAF domain-containing protein [Candidatus Kryptonium thompsoni]CUS82173.1 GAF domain-containing protein [Candidatus Kryptonium thompsoni]CUS82278.1 GAF domain-containing protein [Candidatus Kryptonium thompsoni]CUS83324.1 GAF domain-containing protein [Candidatus Kryptonium thompsoni]
MEQIVIKGETKEEIYSELLPQIKSLIADEPDLIANLANVTSVLKQAFPSFSWVGFYLMKGNELVLGPFQGKLACTRIKIGSGVCGTSALEKKTIIVPDVEKFPGHIYCDPDSKSEIVVPIIKDGEVLGVLDIDSYELNNFDEVDKVYLEKIVDLLVSKF